MRRWTEKTEIAAADVHPLAGHRPRASSTTGERATARSTSTTPGFRATTGWRTGRSGPSSSSTTATRWKATGGLTFMMLDADVVAVSPSSVYRVLRRGRVCWARWNGKPSSKGHGLPAAAEAARALAHGHLVPQYLAARSTTCAACWTASAGTSCTGRSAKSMTEADVEIILQRAREKFPQASPRIISDNGPQFIARDFKEFIRICGMTHVRTSPYYPQSNGKIERWHQSLKGECIRPGAPLSIDDARRSGRALRRPLQRVCLHSAIGYVTPMDKLEGRQSQIFAARDRKLEEARRQRQLRRQNALPPPSGLPLETTGEASSVRLNYTE